jgi:hypothetical protein
MKSWIASVLALFARDDSANFRQPDDWRNKKARKNSGGKTYHRIRTPRAKAWKKVFGGIACPPFTE